MQVFLIKGSLFKVVKNVRLEFGGTPLVEGKELTSPDDQEPFQIDPVVWYKTYVVKTVYIDCEHRCVAWSRDEHEEPAPEEPPRSSRLGKETARRSITIPQNAEYLFADPDIYDFDASPDDLIGDAETLLEKVQTKNIDERTFRNGLARLLHCYILPAIQLRPEDVPALELAYSVVERSLTMVEEDMVHRVATTERLQDCMKKQRERLIREEDFESECHVRSCDRQFLEVFLKDIQSDINSECVDLEGLQRKINELKVLVNGTDTPLQEDVETLKSLRADRDMLHKHIEKLRVVRENIKNVTHRPCRSKRMKKIKVKQSILHTIYIELNNRYDDQKEEQQRISLMKVKVTAVRETLKNKIKKLQQRDNLATSQASLMGLEETTYAMNSLGFHRPEGWLTLEEKVNQLLVTPGNEAHYVHAQHVTVIKDMVKAVRDELRLFRAQPQESLNTVAGEEDLEEDVASFPNGDLIETLGMSARNRRGITVRPRNMSQCHPSTQTSLMAATDAMLENAIKTIKEVVNDHMTKMCLLLQPLMQEFSSLNLDKIWMAYQAVHSEETLPVVRELYMRLKANRIKTLHHAVRRLRLEDVVGRDLIQRLLMRPISRSNSLRDRSSSMSSSSTVSHRRSNSWCDVGMMPRPESDLTLEISRCTSESLYKMATDCGSLPSYIVNMMDPPSCQSSPTLSETGSGNIGMMELEGGEEGVEEEEQVDPEELLRERLDVFTRDFYVKLQEMLKAHTCLDKIRGLTRMFKVVEKHLAEVLRKNGFGADFLLPMTILVLVSLDEDDFTALYVELTMLIDFMPPCLQSGAHDYSITNFLVAYQSLFDEHRVSRAT